MTGIDLNSQIIYKGSSLRFFGEGEKHISRICGYDVLLLVFEGTLIFQEDGVEYEIGKGQYHIQRLNSRQEGIRPSMSPKYLYVHFLGDWQDDGCILPKSGNFDCKEFSSLIEEMDFLSHNGASYTAKTAKFYEILLKLCHKKTDNSLPSLIAQYIEKNFNLPLSLDDLTEKFHFSKNHIINTFKMRYGVTPIAYANNIRLMKAQYLIEVTSDSLESISLNCGFINYSHFYKLFTRKNGISPETWRKQKRLCGF